jgi:CxxC motif-containing protein (DUF1111 family)
MPHVRVHLPALRLPRSPFAPARPGGRLFGIALVGTGLLLLAVASAPVVVGAQSIAPSTSSTFVARDPGVRGGPAGAGGVLNETTPEEKAAFETTKEEFEEVDSVKGEATGAESAGLGPRFNLDGCAGCHAQPDVGGSSPGPGGVITVNPQIRVAKLEGATNTIPRFITADGPVREARFPRNRATGKPDGGVHDLFTITGRTDAVGCNIAQPDFEAELKANNVIFRIPTPVFGLGLVEQISDQAILDNQAKNKSIKDGLGITGVVNREDNAGTITRFGWKAQNKSLEIFAGEAYNVEQGVSNEVFPDEREASPGCTFNSTPEDHSTFTQGTGEVSDTVKFATFMRLLAPPARGRIDTSTAAGAGLALTVQDGEGRFKDIGCGLCHTPSLTTGIASSIDPSVDPSAALSGETVKLFSDLLVHDMGTGLADGVAQGKANGNEFRTAPLWGLGQRVFFLHDGRTKDLVEAIKAHKSQNSEASMVIDRYLGLQPGDQQAILFFLRNL